MQSIEQRAVISDLRRLAGRIRPKKTQAERGLSCPRGLQDQYDDQVRALAAATVARRAGAISAARDELAVTLHDIAEELERYRAPDGDWFPHPPEKFGGDSAERVDQDPPTTAESVS